jgi:hypothetical protein
MRLFELEVIGCRPPANDGVGNGRGAAAFRDKATVGNTEEEGKDTEERLRIL